MKKKKIVRKKIDKKKKNAKKVVKKTTLKKKATKKQPKKTVKTKQKISLKKKNIKKAKKTSGFRSLPAFEYKSVTTDTDSSKKIDIQKNELKFSAKELKEFKASLEKTRVEIIKRIQDKKNLDMPEVEVGDSIDQALQSLDKELLFEVTDIDRMMIDQIEDAIRKIEKGIFGKCQSCKNPITKKRLKVIPFARYCINCQSTNEFSGGTKTE